MGGAPGLEVLLDTHVWLFRLLEPERLSTRLEEVLGQNEDELHLSPISTWETLVQPPRDDADRRRFEAGLTGFVVGRVEVERLANEEIDLESSRDV